MIEVVYAVEGPTDEPVATRLIEMAGCHPRRVFTAQGKSKLDPKIPGYNHSARHRCWLVLRDLDHDDKANCLPDLLKTLANGALAPRLALRLAVQAAEAWLLADVQAFSDFFRVARRRIPVDPDLLDDPKLAVVNTCRASRSRGVRTAMVPREGSGRKVGPEYVATVRAFAADHWDIQRASFGSPSLRRATERVERMVKTGAWSY
jgi:hypothetical protein